MKIELGGGNNPIGNDFINLDRIPGADMYCDFEEGKLRFEDNTIDEVYSAHCLEHVRAVHAIVGEVLRVCKVGAKVLFKQPHWLHEMAMCQDHKQVISERQVKLWCDNPELDFPGSKKRLVLQHVHYQIDVDYHWLRPNFPGMTDQQVAKHIPNCCHEVHFYLAVVEI